MSLITPCLWFDGAAKDAAEYYVAAFRDASKEASVTKVTSWGEAGPGEAGKVLMATFRLAGQDFLALNGGPQFAFTPAISLSVSCADQAEVDHFWARLTDGGVPGQCGWLTDKFGVSWQVVPKQLEAIMSKGDAAQRDRAMRAFRTMSKLDIAAIETAIRDA